MVCSNIFFTSLNPEPLHLHWSLLSYDMFIALEDDLQIAVIITFYISLLDPKYFELDLESSLFFKSFIKIK